MMQEAPRSAQVIDATDVFQKKRQTDWYTKVKGDANQFRADIMHAENCEDAYQGIMELARVALEVGVRVQAAHELNILKNETYTQIKEYLAAFENTLSLLASHKKSGVPIQEFSKPALPLCANALRFANTMLQHELELVFSQKAI